LHGDLAHRVLAEFVEIDQLALGPKDVNANKNHQQKDETENTN
jgi:hypothetical protein